jgi:hypothetical protein
LEVAMIPKEPKESKKACFFRWREKFTNQLFCMGFEILKA